MYHRSDTPFGGTGVNLQAVELREDRVTICPNLVLRILSALIYLCAMLPLGPWLNRRPQPPRPWEIALAFGILLLGALPLWYVQSRSLTVDEFGVEWRALFRLRRLSWRQIRDYGLSYVAPGRVRL